jgi:methionine--tRNA ligase beta chain
MQSLEQLIQELKNNLGVRDDTKPGTCPPCENGLKALNILIEEIVAVRLNFVADSSHQIAVRKTESVHIDTAVNTIATSLNINCLDLRVGVITHVEKHAKADKLYCEQIDVGEDAVRMIASGLVPHYTLEEMMNRRLIVVCNLKPRNLVGFKSHGMVLCAAKMGADGKEKVEFIDPPANARIGERILATTLIPIEDPLTVSKCDKTKCFESVASGLQGY